MLQITKCVSSGILRANLRLLFWLILDPRIERVLVNHDHERWEGEF